ncbi:CMRF35-like molecule 1 isoform X2 [Dipodomys spectabilis]|uniref:CMRF35-like molecule 1 isoform X2 n=1 Tax=Dipodomys spectabilis TaxID=105255 RepID=UPI001C53BB92|nr:CMRF35-like molecule 1 isoform X2 [Dipodomys spectabilis]
MYLPLLFLLVSWLLGCCTAERAITGPRTVRGPEQGSLTVQCAYAASWKTYNKWWCQGARWSSCEILVETSAKEQKVRRGRVSITDDQTNFTIMVTMEDLRMSDADVYWCGIERTGIDLGVEVQVTIDPVLTTVPTTSTATTFSASTSVEETSFFTTLINVNVRHRVIEVSILLPVIFAALLLLLVAASVLAWMKMKRQKKAAEPSVEKPQEDELCYANLSLHQPGASSSSSQHKASIKPSSAGQEEVEYVTMAPLPKTEVSYASLSLDALHQEPTYSNTHIPGTGPETTTEYSSVRWP